MTDKLYPHYSFTNPASVHDEEALTALELCGRLGWKINEIIGAMNGLHFPDVVSIAPSGDETGEIDRITIQALIDKNNCVRLSSGTYHLNAPLKVYGGSAIFGDGEHNTQIKCKSGFIIHDDAVSIHNITVKDVWVRGSGEGTAIDLARFSVNYNTGGRYSTFENIRVSDFEKCVDMAGVWCAIFNHCRFESTGICVHQRETCNNNSFINCQFLGSDKKTTGIKFDTTYGGSENYTTLLLACDFERHKTAVDGYSCVCLHAINTYIEDCWDGFDLDNCAACVIDGLYFAYPENRVITYQRTNALPEFTGSTISIRNVYVKVAKNEDWYLMYGTPEMQAAIENVTVINKGSGRVFLNQSVKGQNYPNGINYTTHMVTTDEFNYRYGSSFKAPRDIIYTPLKQYKIHDVHFVFTQAVSITNNTSYRITTPGGASFLLNINAGDYEVGERIKANIEGSSSGYDHSKLVVDSLETLTGASGTPPTVNVYGKCEITFSQDRYIF